MHVLSLREIFADDRLCSPLVYKFPEEASYKSPYEDLHEGRHYGHPSSEMASLKLRQQKEKRAQ